jgi:hypothetical protein
MRTTEAELAVQRSPLLDALAAIDRAQRARQRQQFAILRTRDHGPSIRRKFPL